MEPDHTITQYNIKRLEPPFPYGDPGTEISRSLRELTSNISGAINALLNWNALYHTGHFIDVVDPDMMARINAVHGQTIKVLKGFKMPVKE